MFKNQRIKSVLPSAIFKIKTTTNFGHLEFCTLIVFPFLEQTSKNFIPSKVQGIEIIDIECVLGNLAGTDN